jgi:hypothetical protein
VSLRDGLRQLGVPVTQVDLSPDPYAYGHASGRLQRLLRWVARRRSSARGPVGALWLLVQGVLAAWVFVSAVPRHDAFILCAHNRMFMTVAYPLLRIAGKRVITVFLGSDVRPPYINAKSVGLVGPVDAHALRSEVQRVRSRLKIAERWSHHVVNHPPSAQFATRRFVDFLTLGIPYQVPPRETRSQTHAPQGDFRVLHAPTDTGAKGTAVIRSAIAELKSSGLRVDYVEVKGRPHAEVVQELERAQLVVDQAYSDQPMPRFATEASAIGVPVVIGSEDWAGATYRVPPGATPPTVRVHPTELAAVISELAVDPERCAHLGRDGQRFVEEQWSPAVVAERFLRLVSNRVPDDWLRSPSDVRYVHGVGLPESRLIEAVRSLVSSFGPDSLGLDTNVEVRDRLLRLARIDADTPPVA